MSQYKKKNILIGGLLAIVVVMGIAYAAFSSNLTITGTGSTTQNWGIKILSITPDKTATQSGGTYTTTGSISQSVTNDLSATFQAALISPGDSVTYTIVVQNFGGIDAELDRITMPSSSNPAISFSRAGLDAGDVITAGGSDTLTVTVTYVNNAGGQGQPAQTTSNFTISLDFVQDDGTGTAVSDGNGSSSASFTGIIYRWSTEKISNGSSISPIGKYIITNGTENAPVGPYDDSTACQTALTGFGSPAGYYCDEYGGLNDYIKEKDYSTYEARATALGHNYYLKHVIKDNVVEESYVCFISDEEHCLKGGDGGAAFSTNTAIIQDYQTYYASQNPNCTFDSSHSLCAGGGFGQVLSYSYGYVNVFILSERCYVYDNGDSYCAQ